MQENEFEKQVQRKMEELKLRPSESVWANIEVQIKKEKRSRRGLTFFPLIIICFLCGMYLLLNQSSSSSEEKNNLSENLIKKNNTDKKAKSSFDTIKNYSTPIEDKKLFKTETVVKINKEPKPKTLSELKRYNSYQPTKNLTKDILKSNNDIREQINNSEKITEQKKSDTAIEIAKQEKPSSNKEFEVDTTIIHKDESVNKIEPDLIKDSTEKENKNVTSAKNKNIRNKNKWSWGLFFSAGSSGMGNSLFGSAQKSFDATSYSIPNSQTGTGIYYSPSLLKPSLAIITGFSVERNLSPKIIFATGLNYNLFRTTNIVGKDSAAYFRISNGLSTYHNSYHYIELPAWLKFQITGSKKVRLYGNTGFSIAQLIASNALQFNGIAGLYYQDNSLLNKTQIRFNTGLDLVLFLKQKNAISIGPYVSYGISKVANQGYNKHHFTYIGLRTQFIFKK